jgi:hypothetical protein
VEPPPPGRYPRAAATALEIGVKPALRRARRGWDGAKDAPSTPLPLEDDVTLHPTAELAGELLATLVLVFGPILAAALPLTLA